MSNKVLVVGSFYPNSLARLEKACALVQVAKSADVASLSDAELSQCSGLMTNGWAPEAVIDRMPELKLISSFGVGYDGVAAGHAASKGILVTHTPDVLNDEVANTALLLLLATKRRLVAYDAYVRQGRWVKEGNAPLTHGLAGKKVGIVGLGRIGEAIAEKLEAFHAEIVYHSRNEKPSVSFQYYGDLVQMARDCDSLIVITPGGPATEKLINADVMNALGADGTLVNLSRGSVVDEVALVVALQDGRLGAAGLDVFVEEPKVPEALFEMDNVVLAPHIGSATVETRQAMNDLTVDNLLSFFDDGSVKTPVPECQSLV